MSHVASTGQHVICPGWLFSQDLSYWLVCPGTTILAWRSHHRARKDLQSDCGMNYRNLYSPWNCILWVHFKFWPRGAKAGVHILFSVQRATWWCVENAVIIISYYLGSEGPSVSPGPRTVNSNVIWRITTPLSGKNLLGDPPMPEQETWARTQAFLIGCDSGS